MYLHILFFTIIYITAAGKRNIFKLITTTTTNKTDSILRYYGNSNTIVSCRYTSSKLYLVQSMTIWYIHLLMQGFSNVHKRI